MIRTDSKTICLNRSETDRWCSNGREGQDFRDALREYALVLARRHGLPVALHFDTGVLADVVSEFDA